MKFAVLGAGALGSVVAAQLHKAGLDVVILDRKPDHVAAINTGGLRVDWDAGSEVFAIPAMHPEAASAVDLVLLLTKTYHSDGALRMIAPLIAAGTHVLTIQNGLGNVERIAAHVPRAQILYGCTMTPGVYLGPGHVSSHGKSNTPFCAVEPGPRAQQFGAALAAADFEMTDAAPALVWKKAAFNCAVNAAGFLGEGAVGDIADHIGPDLATRIAAETVALARAEGIELDLDAVGAQISFAMTRHRAHKGSMLQDLERGRRTEIDALNGFVSRRGRQLGIDTPLNDLLAALVHMKEASRAAAAGT